MARGDVYILRHQAIISTAITIIQIKAGTSYGFEIISAALSQSNSETSQQEEIALVRKSAAATVTTAVVGTHVFLTDPGGPNPNLSLGTAATGVIGTAEGTDGDVILREGFNVLNGWLYMPVPEERIQFRVSDIVALRFLTAPASQLWNAKIVIREL